MLLRRNQCNRSSRRASNRPLAGPRRADTYATSTPVSLHREFLLTHNRKCFVLCRNRLGVRPRVLARPATATARANSLLARDNGPVRTAGGEANAPLIISLIPLALLIAAALVAGFFSYIYNLKRQGYLLCWTAG